MPWERFTTWPIVTAVCDTCDQLSPESGDLGRTRAKQQAIGRRVRGWARAHASEFPTHKVRVESNSSRVSIRYPD